MRSAGPRRRKRIVRLRARNGQSRPRSVDRAARARRARMSARGRPNAATSGTPDHVGEGRDHLLGPTGTELGWNRVRARTTTGGPARRRHVDEHGRRSYATSPPPFARSRGRRSARPGERGRGPGDVARRPRPVTLDPVVGRGDLPGQRRRAEPDIVEVTRRQPSGSRPSDPRAPARSSNARSGRSRRARVRPPSRPATALRTRSEPATRPTGTGGQAGASRAVSQASISSRPPRRRRSRPRKDQTPALASGRRLAGGRASRSAGVELRSRPASAADFGRLLSGRSTSASLGHDGGARPAGRRRSCRARWPAGPPRSRRRRSSMPTPDRARAGSFRSRRGSPS